jgi:hypothetical protein
LSNLAKARLNDCPRLQSTFATFDGVDAFAVATAIAVIGVGEQSILDSYHHLQIRLRMTFRALVAFFAGVTSVI